MNHRHFKSQTNSSNTHLNGKKTKTLGIKCDCSCYKVFFFFILCQRGIYLAVKVNVFALISLE